MSFTLFIPGQPVPCARPRVTRFGTFTPEKTKAYKTYVLQHIRLHWSGPPLEYARVRLLFLMERPKRLMTRNADPGRCWCNVKPDADNLAKPPLDAAKEVGVFEDDGRVVWLEVLKLYRAIRERPGVIVDISEVGPVPEEWLRLGREASCLP